MAKKHGSPVYAGYPFATAFESHDGKNDLHQLPWSFQLFKAVDEPQGTYKVKDIQGKTREGKYVPCHRIIKGGVEQKIVWIREHELQLNRCLEVVLVDIGQGDGCLVVTPEGKQMVIDAGEGANMRHYLNWRNGTRKNTSFEAAIITHPDSDHYQGFAKLFERANFFFETIYTNGLMEFPEKSDSLRLGPVESLECQDGVNRKLVTNLVTSKKELEAFLKGKGKPFRNFPSMLNDAMVGKKEAGSNDEPVTGQTMGDFKMLSAADKYLPGYEKGKPLSIQVLGPVPDIVNKRPMLRWLSSPSKTKNGHSVVLRFQYGNVSLMLGGDLNVPSEHLLLSHHTGMVSPPKAEDSEKFVAAARKVFQVDIAKSCHHGSSDFTSWFLMALNPVATVISSGDDEPHSHPRSDTLGAIGKYSRCQGEARPLIFSTELARSTKDDQQKPWEIRSQIWKQVEQLLAAKPEKQQKLKEKLKEKLIKDIDRSVAVYGAITVVTDGTNAIVYQKLEQRSSHNEYDIYRFEPTGKDGSLEFVQQKH